MRITITLATLCAGLARPAVAQTRAPEPAPPLALVGATVIDGRGGTPIRDATIVVVDGRITAIGPSSRVTIPANARRLDVAGRFITPGFIDANVHLTPYNAFDNFSGPESLFVHVALQGARDMVRRGITTARDTYGYLAPLLEARARLARDTAGLSLLVAGNIIGWGGPWSFSFGGNSNSVPPTDYARAVRDDFVLGMGENLVEVAPDSLRRLIDRYLDRGVDFVKLGVTTHFERPAYLLFSPPALEAMIAAAHARGTRTDAHAGTVEALQMVLRAGVDVIQHPEVVGGNRIPRAVADALHERHTICAMMPNRLTGAPWERFQAHLAMGGVMWPPEMPPALVARRSDSLRTLGIDPLTRPRTASVTRFANERANAELLVAARCTIAVSSDDLVPSPTSTVPHEMGEWFLDGVVGLVELGMSPAAALMAATRNGARAAGRDREVGTLAAGMRADLNVLSADPLADIRNIRKLEFVVIHGRVVRP